MLSLFSTSLNIFDDADRIVGTNDSDPVAERLCHKHKCHDGTNSAWYVTSSWNSFSFLSAPRECVSQHVFIVSIYILLTKGRLRMYQKSDCIPLTRFIVSVIGMFNQCFHAVSLYFRCDYGAERLKKKKKIWSNINKGLQIFSSRWICLQNFGFIACWLIIIRSLWCCGLSLEDAALCWHTF